MHARALRPIVTSFLAIALLAASAVAQTVKASPIGTIISGGGGSAPATTPTVPRPHVLPGTLVVPDSSKINAADLGKKAHTNFMYVMPGTSSPLEAPPYSGYAYETPTSLGCVYHLSAVVAGCNPNTVTSVITGGSNNIAIVDAFDDPEAAADLAYFSDQFGIPFSVNQFQVIYADGFQPSIDVSGGWELEESLDIEYAHAMAPKGNLYLVGASSNSFTDLTTAVVVATNLIQCGMYSTTPGACTTKNGKGDVSMSWGGSEFSGETALDANFNQANVVFFASSGDSPGPIYPSTSPNVVSVGGTSIVRSLVNGNYVNEIGWDDAGSGISSFEAVPSYQSSKPIVSSLVGTHRGTPDVAAVANPYTGVWVYDTMPFDYLFYASGWWVVGGTSVASPVWTGIVNNAGATNGFAASSNAELTRIYGNLPVGSPNYNANLKDITYGYCFFYMGYADLSSYDLCTGLGSPVGLGGK